MPIYEYECHDCHHKFDLMQKIHEPAVNQCPHCAANSAVRLVSAPGFQLKGSGWYATDFKDKPKAAINSESAADTKPKPDSNIDTNISSNDTKATTAAAKSNHSVATRD